jgi:hypothetical protein
MKRNNGTGLLAQALLPRFRTEHPSPMFRFKMARNPCAPTVVPMFRFKKGVMAKCACNAVVPMTGHADTIISRVVPPGCTLNAFDFGVPANEQARLRQQRMRRNLLAARWTQTPAPHGWRRSSALELAKSVFGQWVACAFDLSRRRKKRPVEDRG